MKDEAKAIHNAHMSSSSPSRPLAYACLALSMTLVGCYVALSKPLAATFPVLLLAWLRFGLGGLGMLSWLRKPAAEPPLSPKTHWLVFLESLFGNFLFTLCMVAGVAMTNAVTASVTMAAMPATVAVMGWIFLREQLHARLVIAILLGGLGIALLALSQSQMPTNATHPVLGQLLLIGALLCESAYSIIGKQLTGQLSAKRITALINLWGLVLASPAGLYLAWQFPFATVGWGTWVLLLFYALAACIWTVWLWMTGLKTIPASQAGVFTVCLPISTAITGVLFLDERLAGMQWLALALALLGIVLATLPLRKR